MSRCGRRGQWLITGQAILTVPKQKWKSNYNNKTKKNKEKKKEKKDEAK